MLRALWNFESQFSTKQVFLSLQMTACFSKNDVWFWWKRRVVLVKTTCGFGENDVWFSMKGKERENTHPRNKNREQRIRIVKIPITPIPRAHAYTRIPGVFAFLLSQVSQNNRQHTIIQSITTYFQTYFNKHEFQRLKIGWKLDQKSFFSFFRPPKFARFFPPNFPLCDTCDSKKSTSLLEGAHVRAYVKQKTRQVIFLSSVPNKIEI